MALLLNPRFLIALALAGFLAFTHFAAYRAGKANVRADFDAYRIEQASLTAEAERSQRAEEARRNAERDKVIQEAQDAKKTAEDDAAAARGARDGLLSAAASAAGRACQGAKPAQGGKGKSDPMAVLIDVLGAVGERASVYAEAADRARIAGLACERAYTSLTVEATGKILDNSKE